MAYWCDDQALNLEQRRLDADQARAKRRIEAMAARQNAKEATDPTSRKAETPKGENDDN